MFQPRHHGLTPDPSRLYPPYLVELLRTKESHFERQSRGATIKGIARQCGAEHLAIPLPSLAGQRRIAEVLDRAEALRAKRRAALAQLDTLTQSIFLSLFGDPATNPKGWPIHPLADYVAEFQGGKSIEAESGENAVTVNRVLKISAVTGMKFLRTRASRCPIATSHLLSTSLSPVTCCSAERTPQNS